MVNIKAVFPLLKGRVGFKNLLDLSFVVDGDNLHSGSGLFVTDFPNIDGRSIKACLPIPNATDTQVNEWLVDTKRIAINNVCNSIFNNNEFLDSAILYSVSDCSNEYNSFKRNGFQFYELTNGLDRNIGISINSIELEFEGTGDLEIVLFNAKTGIVQESKTVTISSQFQTESLYWNISNLESYKAKYYIGFITDSNTSLKPIKRTQFNSGLKQPIKGVGVSCKVMEGLTTVQRFNTQEAESVTQYNGVNLNISTFKDYTAFIVSNKSLFDRAIHVSWGITLLRELLNSQASNPDQRKAHQNQLRIIQQIEGQKGEDLQTVTGLNSVLYGSIGSIKNVLNGVKTELKGGRYIKRTTIC